MMSRCFTTRSLEVCAFLALAPLFWACDEAPQAEPETAPLPSRTRGAELFQEPPAPSAFSGELTRFEDDVAAFVSLESCESDLGQTLPSSLGDIFADLRYERVVADVCVGLAAGSERNASRCDELATRTLQEGCRRRVATLLGDPAVCSLSDEDTDVLCLAWATGRAELCAGAPSHERVVCDAVARGDASVCGNSRVPSEATCTSLVMRHGPRVPKESPQPIEVRYEGSVRLPSGDVSLSADVSRGVMVHRVGCVPEFVIEGQGSPRVDLALGAPDGSATMQYFDGQTILGIRVPVTIQNPVFEMQLGGRIAGTVETEVELDGRPVELSLQFQTYVRNWLAADECLSHDATLERHAEQRDEP